MFTSDATLTEDEFQDCLQQAHDGMLISDWTPWGDVNDALEAIAHAAAGQASTMALTTEAWKLYRAHTT